MANRKSRRAAARARNGAKETPSPVGALFDAAVQGLRAGRQAEATDLLGQVLQIDPRHLGALQQLGVLAYRAGRGDLARSFFVRALDARPDIAAGHFNLGLAQLLLLDIAGAAASFREAIALDPTLAEAHVALGDALQSQGRLDEADAAFQQAIRLRPDYAEAFMNRGNVLRDLGRLTAAAAAGRRAVELKPDSAVAHRNLALVLQDQGLVSEAIAAFDRALALDPDFPEAQSGRLNCLNYDPTLSAAAIAAEHRRWGERLAGKTPLAGRTFACDRNPDRRLRIGYVSGDLNNHPVGVFLRRVLETHEPASVEVFCYSNSARFDETTQALSDAADHWRSLWGLSDQACDAMIRADGVDLLVDLSGHVAANRLAVFNRRPAPVQASWLGYVATTGLPSMDYLITDSRTVPPGSDSLFTERLVRLPHGRFCYAPPDYAPAPAPPPSARGGPFTFGCFNQTLKIGHEVVRLWSRVLRATPGSMLRLKWKSMADPGVRARLTAAFGAEGIEPERLEFRGHSPHAAMLAEYGEIDVALDPFPFCGGLTTCEALWMGAPVVTLPMERAASRQSLSFLDVLGLTELVAESESEYVSIAADLAGDPARLAELRARLRPCMAASPICSAEVFTPTLEAAYRQMWKRWCDGEPPVPFDIHAAQ